MIMTAKTKSKATEAAMDGEKLPEGVVVEEATSTVLPKVKQIIRYISRQAPDPQSGHFGVGEIDSYLSGWIGQGYELFNTHYLGENPEGFGVLYILKFKE